MKPSCSKTAGFTLVEIIVTLTVSAILAVMLMQFIGTSISRSAQPALSLQAGTDLQSVFESMNADYKQLLLTDPAPLTTFKNRVDGGFYGSSMSMTSNYIVFDQNQREAPCNPNNTDCRLLKVTVSKGNQSLTTLFAR